MPLNLEIGDLRVAVTEGVAGVAEAWQRIIFLYFFSKFCLPGKPWIEDRCITRWWFCQILFIQFPWGIDSIWLISMGWNHRWGPQIQMKHWPCWRLLAGRRGDVSNVRNHYYSNSFCVAVTFFCVLGNHQGFFWRPWSLLKSQVDRNFQQDHSKGRCDLVQNFHAAVALTLGWSQKSTLSVGTAVSQHFQLQCEKAKNRTLKSRKIWRLSNTERLKRWVFFCGASAQRIERRDANWKTRNLSTFHCSSNMTCLESLCSSLFFLQQIAR